MAEISKRALSAKTKGRRGGLATARNNSREFLEARSEKAGQSTLSRYGTNFYSYIRTLRPKPRSSKDKVREVIQTVIPVKEPIPENTVSLMQAAAKSLG